MSEYVFCTECGNKCDVTFKFCNKCGNELIIHSGEKGSKGIQEEILDSCDSVEQDEAQVRILLEESNYNKIEAIKKYRSLTGKGLRESKDMIDKVSKGVVDTNIGIMNKSSKKSIEKEKLNELRNEGIPYCPKCHSTSLSANKRGWKLATGLLGSSKVLVTCLNCGYKFKPGKK